MGGVDTELNPDYLLGCRPLGIDLLGVDDVGSSLEGVVDHV